MNDTKLTRGARVWLILVVIVFVVGIGLSVAFFMQPTDGWLAGPADEVEDSILIYQENLLGLPSGLQPGDMVVGAEGLEWEQAVETLDSRWRAGATLRYSVIRDGTALEIPVTLGMWDPGRAVWYWLLMSSGSGFVGMLLFFAIATLAFIKRPNDHAARALFWYAALFPSLSALGQISQSNPAASINPMLSLGIGVATFGAYSVMYPPALLQLALVFPRPKPIVQRHPWLEYAPYALGLVVIPFFLTGIYIVGFIWTALSILGAMALVVHSALTMRDALSRAQLAWGLWGFVLSLAMLLATYLDTFRLASGVVAQIGEVLAGWSFSVLGITLGIAILRYRLFDIGIIIRRTLTYVLVTIPLLLVYFGSIVVLQQIFSALTGSGQNEIVTVVSTLAIAALFIPVRNRIQVLIDRRFNRRKYDAQKVLNDFANTVRDETNLESLTGRLIQVVDETMQPKSVSVWLKQTSENTRTTTWL